ncbi:MAG: SDR family oxidoreductase [Deltaproteobacteria bacterium]|nr:SDR family oxidoreductase [Deltaproteobacteria bacterium]
MTTALVTGANRGIGLELARQLAAQGHEVIGVCRTSSPELDAVAEVWAGIDVGSDACIATLKEKAAGRTIDIVVNNAGILRHEGLESLVWDNLRAQFEVNSMGPLRVTQALLDSLGRGAKVAIVTSRMGSIADNTSGGAYGYRMSKAAVNAAGVSLANDLESQGIAVILLHPGWVQTGMTGGRGHLSAAESAAGLIARIDELTLHTTGSFHHAQGEELPW